jgi:hypothetical protein
VAPLDVTPVAVPVTTVGAGADGRRERGRHDRGYGQAADQKGSAHDASLFAAPEQIPTKMRGRSCARRASVSFGLLRLWLRDLRPGLTSSAL